MEKNSGFSIDAMRRAVAEGERIQANPNMTDEDRTREMLSVLEKAEIDSIKSEINNIKSEIAEKLVDCNKQINSGGILRNMSLLMTKMRNYISYEPDKNYLFQKYKLLFDKFNEIQANIVEVSVNYTKVDRTKQEWAEELKKLEEDFERLIECDKQCKSLISEIDEKSKTKYRVKTKIKGVAKGVKNFARRFNYVGAAGVVSALLVIGQIVSSSVYRGMENANEDYFFENYVVGETAEQLGNVMSSNLRQTFEVMTRNEMKYKDSDTSGAQYKTFETDFIDMLNTVDEYVKLANKKERTVEEQETYCALANKIDSYQGYVNLEGEAIGFNKTMELMIKAKLANAMEAEGNIVNNIEEDIQITQHERYREEPAYKTVSVKFINQEGENKKFDITDETWFLLFDSSYLNVEIASLTNQMQTLKKNFLSVDEKVEIMQVVAAMVNEDKIKFNSENGKFSMEDVADKKETVKQSANNNDQER